SCRLPTKVGAFPRHMMTAGSTGRGAWRVRATTVCALLLVFVAVGSVRAAPLIGGTIAYIQSVGLTYEIYIVEAGSRNPRRVWRENNPVTGVKLSPDGRTVVFESSRERGFWDTELYVVDVDGTEHAQITDFGGESEIPSGPTWSPDGSRLAYGSYAMLSDATLTVATRDGADPRVLLRTPPSRFEYLAWSPRGAAIAYYMPTAGFGAHIMLISVASGETTSLTSEGGIYIAWAPDGTQLAFVRGMGVGQTRGVYALKAQPGADVRLVTQAEMDSSSLSWVDARHIAYLSVADFQKIHITDLAGKAQTPLDVGATARLVAFDWVDPARAVEPGGKVATTLGNLKAGVDLQ
ncbi:hypothetical protein HN937_01760, partial [Candidatus Poribacteria bacterium]|nr:hypothetical protein [Candidatus Poribacteria bacterium]